MCSSSLVPFHDWLGRRMSDHRIDLPSMVLGCGASSFLGRNEFQGFLSVFLYFSRMYGYQDQILGITDSSPPVVVSAKLLQRLLKGYDTVTVLLLALPECDFSLSANLLQSQAI